MRLSNILSFSALLTSGFAQSSSNSSTSINGVAFPSLFDATTEDLIIGLESGLFTSVDLTQAYISRINEVNDTLKPVTQLNPDALAIARTLDAERQNGTVRGPLHGIPILIKNNIATADQMDNDAGSYALAGAKVPRDSTIAAKLRAAGVIILGKANLSQWANFRSFNTTNGWSALGGQVIGAYFPDQDPSGSSSGSAVGTSLGLALMSLGSETDGSIISPSDYNNVVGIKPTVGLVSRDLVIPISEHQDTVGPIARTVRDAAYLLSVVAGYSTYDNYTSAIPFPNYTIPDYVGACNFTALSGKRIGIPRNVFDTPELRNSTYNAIIERFNSYALPILKDAGAILVDNITWPGWDMPDLNSSIIVLESDFVSDLPKYTEQLIKNPNGVVTLEQLRDYTIYEPLEDLATRDIDIWIEALDYYGGQNNSSPYFWGNYTFGLELAGPLGLTGSLQNYSLDAVIMPTAFASHFPALLGTPVISVPLGSYPPNTPVTQDERGLLNATGPGMPFGISFMAERFSEEKLIGLAYAFEQRSHVRQQVLPLPQNIPKTELRDIVANRTQSRRSRF